MEACSERSRSKIKIKSKSSGSGQKCPLYRRVGRQLAVERPTSRKGREKWGTPSLETVLDVDYSDQFFHGGGALVEGCFLFRRQFNFDNLLDSLGSELYWNADV